MGKESTRGSGDDREVRRIWTRFLLYAFGVFLVYSAYGTLLSLQSSVNVVDGLGTTALSAIYVSAVIFSVLCVPGLIRKFGAKKCMCCSEITYFIYTLANFYPTFYTMLPASLIVGVGDCLLWACFPILNSFFANQHSSVSEKNKGRTDESRFSGYFFAIFQMSKVIGNLISYTVLYGFNKRPATNVKLNFTELNQTTGATASATAPLTSDLSYCGANDCQDADAVHDAIEQYVPASKWALYTLLTVMAVLCTSAVALHVMFIPNDEIYGVSSARRSRNSRVLESETPVRETSKIKSMEENEIDNGKESEVSEMVRCPGKSEEAENILDLNDNIKDNYLTFGISLAKDIARQMIDVKQLLLMPMIFYAGLDFGFVTSELTRSYTSCVFGVSWVPIHTMFFGVGAVIMCYLMGKFSKRISRSYLVGFAAICDCGMYIYCLLWTPSASSHLSVIPMYLFIGGMQGIWVPVSQVLEVLTFPDRLDVCSPVWNFWFMLGIGTQFAWSTSLCVSAKIYIQLGFVCCSVVGFALLERIRSRQPSDEESIPEQL